MSSSCPSSCVGPLRAAVRGDSHKTQPRVTAKHRWSSFLISCFSQGEKHKIRIYRDKIPLSWFFSTVPGVGHRFLSPRRLYPDTTFIYFYYFYFTYMGVLPACMSVHYVHVWCHGNQWRVLNTLELVLQVVCEPPCWC